MTNHNMCQTPSLVLTHDFQQWGEGYPVLATCIIAFPYSSDVMMLL